MRLLLLVALLLSSAAFALTPAEIADIERRAQAGEPEAQNLMGAMHAAGKGAVRSDAQAVEWFLRAAQKGHIEAQHNLAVIYERTGGTLKDPVEARRWYAAAAQKGFARSQAKLGEFFLYGVGGPLDVHEARAWLEKAAAQHEPHGQYLLGLMRLEDDPKEGARLIELAAESKHRDAQYELARLYGTGRGVAQDDAKSLEWMMKSAEQGQAKAQYLVGVVYGTGRYGVPRNDAESLKWLRRSALQDNADAEFQLGLAYAEGRGVKRDPQEALGWIARAARRGHDAARQYMRKIESGLQK